MKITYTGQATFTAVQRKKLDTKLAKLSKLIDRGGEKEAHVILTAERHLHRAEITVHVYDHPLVVMAAQTDQFQSVSIAIEKLEQQILKLREKWRDTKRRPAAKAKAALEAMEAPAPKAVKAPAPKVKTPSKAASDSAGKRVFRVNNHSRRKPMTVEEAILEMSDGQDYKVYRDAESDRVHVLVKRPDGHFDLIES